MNNMPLDLFRDKPWVLASVIMIVLGIVGTIIGFMLAPLASWFTLDAVFLVALGIMNGMFAWVATFRVAQARWTAAIVRTAQSSLAFVPVMAIFLIVLLAGAPAYMTWVKHPIHDKQGWLNMPFFVIRELLLLGVFWGLILVLTRLSFRADLQDRDLLSDHTFHYRLNTIAAVATAVYSITSTVVAWDFIMSLSPEWVSTMFGAYIFCTNVYAGMALIVLLTTAALHLPLARNYLQPQQFKDMGNLMLAFALFNMGLFYAQYLTIWYENIPYETQFILVRYMYGFWPKLGWTSLILGYAIPFVILQSRHVKTHPKLLSIVSVIALAGFALERYVLVIPSLKTSNFFPSLLVLLMLPGLVGAFILCVRWFTHKYPAVSSAQDALNEMNNPEAEIRL